MRIVDYQEELLNGNVFAFVQARRSDKTEAHARMLAAAILSKVDVGLVGSGARVIVIGPRAEELLDRALRYAKDFLDGMD